MDRRALIAAALLALAACGSKRTAPSGPPPELTGLAAVPATVEVVIGADINRLAGAPVVERAVAQLLSHNEALSERWQRLQSDCKVDVAKQVKRVLFALGPRGAADAGTGPVLMVVVGSIAETELKDCVAKLVGGGGGAVTGTAVAGRTLYQVKDGNRTMYFAYGRPDTVVLGSSEAFVTEALGAGKKASDNPDLARWLKLVNQNAALWAVGRVDPRVRDGMARVADGKLGAGPTAFGVTADLSAGAKLELAAVMAKPEDAKNLESFVKGELALLTAAAQWKSLGAVVGKLTVAAEAEIVRLSAPLTVEDLNQLLSVLDGGTPPAQDSAPPSPGSGSGT